MSTRGFENFTEADAMRLGRRPDLAGPVVSIEAVDKAKRHKFGARACIVTEDLTLFTTAAIHQMATLQRRSENRLVTPLKELARACGIIGDRFASEREAKRYIVLAGLQSAGAITGLRRQERFDLTAHGRHICRWDADFCYDEKQPDGTWESVFEDCKGMRTPEYKLKKKLFEAERKVAIRET